MQIIIKEENIRQRLDIVLSNEFPDMTRSFIQKIIKDGLVKVNNIKVFKSSFKLNEHDSIEVEEIETKSLDVEAEDIPLEIVYEDKDILLINKSAGMVVHPTESGDHQTGTIVNAVLFHCKQDLSGIGGVARPGILHRLDKETSGLLTVAKNDLAHQYLAKQIHDREVKKFYYTLIKGKISPQKGSIDAPIFRSMKNRKKMEVSRHAKARRALTHYEVLEEFGDVSLVKVQIITGRTHQIRVHFSSIGFPVVGDDLYGDSKFNNDFEKNYGLKRQFLHAAQIGFNLPSSKKWIEFEAPLTEDLESVLEKLREEQIK